MNYKLTPMTAEHVPQIAALERECFSHPWSEEMLLEELWNDSAVIITAEGEDGTVLGYAGLQTVLDEGYINNVAVAPDNRRQGVAGELIAAFIRFEYAIARSFLRRLRLRLFCLGDRRHVKKRHLIGLFKPRERAVLAQKLNYRLR